MRRNKWFDKLNWLEYEVHPAGYWNDYDNCLAETKKYVYKSDFHKKSDACYRSCLIHGWLKDFEWLQSKQITYSNKKDYSGLFISIIISLNIYLLKKQKFFQIICLFENKVVSLHCN